MKKLAGLKKASLGILLMISIILSSFISLSSSAAEHNDLGVKSKFKRSSHTIQYEKGNKKFEIRSEGEIVISDDDKNVIAIKGDGFLEITTKSFGSKRKIVIESDNSGNLIRKYYVGFSKKEFDPAGKEWLAKILPEVVKNSGIGAKSRVDRFYNKGGVSSVIEEVESMDSDYVKSIYVNLLMTKEIRPNELVSILDMLGKQIDSDHYLSQILMKNQKQFTSNDKSSEAYIDAISNLESDHYITTVLKKVIKDESISDKDLNKVFKIFELVESDHYLTTIMNEYLKYRTQDEQTLKQALEFAKQIESDHYKVELIKGIIKKSVATDEFSAENFLPFISEINSDHYVVLITNMLIEKMMLDEKGISEVLNLSNQIESDHYKLQLYYKILDNNTLSDDTYKKFYAQMSEIESDHYKVEGISKIISTSKGELVYVDELLELVDGIESDHYATIVFKMIAKQNKLSDDQLVKIFELASRNFDSDHYLTEVLVAFSRRVKDSSDSVKTAFQECAKSISSDTYFGRAMRSIR